MNTKSPSVATKPTERARYLDYETAYLSGLSESNMPIDPNATMPNGDGARAARTTATRKAMHGPSAHSPTAPQNRTK